MAFSRGLKSFRIPVGESDFPSVLTGGSTSFLPLFQGLLVGTEKASLGPQSKQPGSGGSDPQCLGTTCPSETIHGARCL